MFKDLKFAWRRLLSAPAFTLTAILTLALAIGANTAVFSIADALLFRPMPYADPDRVFVLQTELIETGEHFINVPYSQLDILRDNDPDIEDIAMSNAIGAQPLLTETADGVEVVPQITVTPNYFDLLGVQAYRGRTFLPDDDAESTSLALLTYDSWQQRFGADETIIGKPVTLASNRLDIVGVLPPGFIFPTFFLTPLQTEVIKLMPLPRPGQQGGALYPIARLARGVSPEQAQARIRQLMATADPEKGEIPALTTPQAALFNIGRPVAAFLLIAAGLVLLIGCSNLAIMLFVRGQRSLRETGVRVALGASRSQLVIPIVLEACILGIAGAVLALLVTSATFGVLESQVPEAAIRYAPVGVSSRVVVYSLAMGLLGGGVFSVVPAWRSVRADAQSLILGHEQRTIRRGRLGRPLIAMQVALAVVLVVGAMSATRSLIGLLNEPLGFDAENVITAIVTPGRETTAENLDVYLRMQDALNQRQDVLSTSGAMRLPMVGRYAPMEGVLPDRAGGLYYALPGYVETAGIRLLRGRTLTTADMGLNNALVSESLARRLDPEGSGIGTTFQSTAEKTYQVVGILDDFQDSVPDPPAFTIPGPEAGAVYFDLVVRMRTRNAAALTEVRRLIGDLAPGRPVRVAWWSDSIDSLTQYSNPRFQTLVLGGFSTLALALTALGIFAVVAFSVAIRRREMGIRIAVGAQPRSLIALILRQSMAPVLAGLAIGLVASTWTRTLAESYLGKIQLEESTTLIAAVLTVSAAALLAAYMPARRASRVDAMSVLKTE